MHNKPVLAKIKHNIGYEPESLLDACYSGDCKEVVNLINKKGRAILNATDKKGFFPLYIATCKGHVDVCRLLLENGADVNQQTKASTPLICACLDGHEDLIKLFIACKANVDAKDLESQMTALGYAATNGHLVACRLLLQANASFAVKDTATMLHCAAGESHFAVCELGLQWDQAKFKANINDANKDGRTALHYAVSGRNIEIVQLLIKNGINLDVRDAFGVSALDLSLSLHESEIANNLLSAGAKTKTKNLEGNTALHISVIFGNANICKLILLKNQNHEDLEYVNEQNSMGMTPMHVCVLYGLRGIGKILLDSGASLDAVDEDGMTPMMAAVESGDEDICRMLMEAGASLADTNEDEETVLHICAIHGRLQIASLLIESLQPTDAHHLVNSQDKDDTTPLHYAAANGDLDFCKLLLSHGADMNLEDNDGFTPLMAALESKQNDAVKYLRSRK